MISHFQGFECFKGVEHMGPCVWGEIIPKLTEEARLKRNAYQREYMKKKRADLRHG